MSNKIEKEVIKEDEVDLLDKVEPEVTPVEFPKLGVIVIGILLGLILLLSIAVGLIK